MKISREAIDRYNLNSWYKTLGIQVESVENGRTVTKLRPEEPVCWPFPGQPHGGVLFSLMDTTMAWSTLSKIETGYNCSTIHMDIQYTRPAQGKYFTCKAQVLYKTGRTCFLKGEIYDREDRIVAMAQSAFRIFKSDLFDFS